MSPGATNQGRILGSLLESSKTTAELANELGYVDSEGSPRYDIIYKDLKKLEENGYIESKREKLDKKPGSIPTSYSILYNIQNLKKILEEYPNLVENMQNNELALETIVNENSNWIFNSTADEHMGKVEDTESWVEMGKKSWKEKLKLSKEFFAFCLKNKRTDMMESVRKLAEISSEYRYIPLSELKITPTSSVSLWKTNYRIYMVFKACVASDILRGESQREAIEYLEKRKNEVLEEQYKQLKEYYSNTKVAPEFLRGKEFTPVEDPKLRELEQEFMDKGGKFVN